jgi:hypothetical protein
MLETERIKIGNRFINLTHVEEFIIGDFGLDKRDPLDVTLIFMNSTKTFTGKEALALKAYLERTSIDLDVEADNPNMAKNMSEQVTPRQLGAIRSIANCNRQDAEAESLRLNKCKPEELSRRAASALIDHLKNASGEAQPVAV